MPSTTSSLQSPPQPTRLAPTKPTSAKMLRQTYSLAHLARGKLSHEAARADHDLRLLVGHANLLDTLMIELAEAEEEQESWFNASLQSASESQKHIQWAPVVAQESEYEDDDNLYSSSDSESDFDEDEEDEEDVVQMVLGGLLPHIEQDEEDYEDDMEEDYESLSLVRTQSRSSMSSPPTSPPELSHDLEGDSSEDESMPPSPPATSLPTFSEKQRQQIVTTSLYDSAAQPLKLSTEEQASFLDDGFYLPPRSTSEMIPAISAY